MVNYGDFLCLYCLLIGSVISCFVKENSPENKRYERKFTTYSQPFLDFYSIDNSLSINTPR